MQYTVMDHCQEIEQLLWNDLKGFFIDLSEIDEEYINMIKKKYNLK